MDVIRIIIMNNSGKIKKNIKLSAINYMVTNALKFIMRVVFIRTLSIEYLGVNGLFSNILAMLSLAELGIGPAIVYSLYKPLAINNIVQIKGIMKLFKRVYIFIGLLILCFGIVLYPYLDFFIKDGNSITDLNYFYLIFLLNTAVSYFWSYQRNLLIADQKQYIVNNYQIIVQAFIVLTQIAVLFIFKSYWGFILLMLGGTIAENYLIARRSYEEYPFLKNNNENIDNDIKKQIVKNTSAMMVHKIAAMIVFSSSNIIISKYIGLVSVGYYSNYYMVINVIRSFCGKIFEAITASIGNLIVLGNEDQKIESFMIVQFVNALQASVITVGLYTLFDSFIIIWLGDVYLLDRMTVASIVVLFYLSYMRNVVVMYRDACGLFWYDRFKAVAEAILNPVISVILVKQFGIMGVVWGSIITTLCICFWVEPYVLFKYGIKFSFRRYLGDYIKYTGCTIAGIIICVVMHNYIYRSSVFFFILFIFVSIFTTIFIWILVFRKRQEMNFLKNVIKKRIIIKA